jgi:tetratricopeptide (TPR) repeat protein
MFTVMQCIVRLVLLTWFLTGGYLYAQDNSVFDELSTLGELKTVNPDSAFYIVKSAYLQAQKSENDSLMAQYALHLGEILFYLGDFENASTYLMEAFTFFEAQNDSGKLALAYTWQGITLQYARQLQLAHDYYSRAHLIYESVADTLKTGELLGWIGHYYEKTGQTDTALVLQYKAYDLIKKKNQNARALARIYDNIGSIYEDLNIYDSAQHYFHMSLRINRRYNEINDQIVNLNNIGDVHRKKGQYDMSLMYTDSALTLAYQFDIGYQKRSAHRDLSKLFAAKGDFEQSFHHLEKAYQIYSEIINEENTRRMSLVQALYESERKENRISILEQDKKINRMLRLGMIGVFVVFVVVAAVIGRGQVLKLKQGKKIIVQNNQIMEKNKELAEMEMKNALLKEERLNAEIQNQKLIEQQLQQNLELKSQLITSQALQVIRKNNFLENLKAELQKIKKAEKHDRFDRINSLMKYINQDLSNDENWNDFNMIFSQVHKDFFSSLLNKFPDISASEVRLCSLIKLNLQSQEIATILGISLDSLRIARHRLRKKLQLNKDENLSVFITNI